MRNFIVYSQESPEHMDRVRRLATDLVEAGLACEVDLLARTPAEGWRRWTEEQAHAADVVLCVISAPFAQRVEGALSGDKSSRHDAKLAAKLLARTDKTLFVIVPDGVDEGCVPSLAMRMPRFHYPSNFDGLRAALAARALAKATGDGKGLTTTSPSTPVGKRMSSGAMRAAGVASPPRSTSAAVRDYLETLVAVYETSGAAELFVRPSADIEGTLAEDLVTHAKESLIREPSALLMLLGDYGTGKSCAAQRIGYELAKDFLAGRADVPIPFYMNLSFARGQVSLTKAITLFAARYNVRLSERELLEILAAGPATALVLDGLDEMGERIKREEATRFAEQLGELRKHTGLRVFLTCRSNFYKDSVDDDQIPATRKLTLLPFNDRQIDAYLAHTPVAVRARLSAMLDRAPRLRELCRTPIHLLLSQEYVAERSDVSVDFRLIDLYDAFVRKNLSVHAATNPGWSPRARRDFVRRLAYHMFDEGLVEMTTEELLRVLSEELPDASPAERAETATQIKNCSFFVRAGATFRPLHLSFLEYFVAEVLVEELYEGRIDRWNRRPLYAEVFDFMIQMIQRRGVERLPFAAIVASEKEAAPANFIATMYRWPVPEVRPYFEQLLLEGVGALVRCTACNGVGVYDSADVVSCLFTSFDREKNTIIRAVVQRLLQRLRDQPPVASLRADIDARLAVTIALSKADAEAVLRTKRDKFALQAYRKALMLGDLRPSSTIAAMYLLAGVNDLESFPHIERVAHESRLPVVRETYEHARTLAPLPALAVIE